MARGGRYLTLTRLDCGRTRLQAGTGRDHALSIQDPWEDALEAPPVMSSLWPVSCGVSAQPSISSGLPKRYGLLCVCLSTGTRTQGLTLAIRHAITEPGPPLLTGDSKQAIPCCAMPSSILYCVLGKYSTTDLHSQPSFYPFTFFFFDIGSYSKQALNF